MLILACALLLTYRAPFFMDFSIKKQEISSKKIERFKRKKEKVTERLRMSSFSLRESFQGVVPPGMLSPSTTTIEGSSESEDENDEENLGVPPQENSDTCQAYCKSPSLSSSIFSPYLWTLPLQ